MTSTLLRSANTGLLGLALMAAITLSLIFAAAAQVAPIAI